MSEATFTFRVDEALKNQFTAAAKSRDRTTLAREAGLDTRSECGRVITSQDVIQQMCAITLKREKIRMSHGSSRRTTLVTLAARVMHRMDLLQSFACHVSINLRSGNVGVAQQQLDDTQIGSVVEQMCGESVPQCVG